MNQPLVPLSDSFQAARLSLYRVAALARLHAEVPFDGTVDTSTSPEVTGHLLAMAGEALTNVARHARSTTVEVMVQVYTPLGYG